MAADGAGNLLAMEGNAIRKIAEDGYGSTLAGSFTAPGGSANGLARLPGFLPESSSIAPATCSFQTRENVSIVGHLASADW